MIRISKLTDYAMIIMTFLGKHADRFYQANEIAKNITIARPTVAKLLKQLTKSNLLISTRGATGGYKLAKLSEEISVISIIEALEGPLAIMECNLGKQYCSISPVCTINAPWLQVNQVIYNALKKFKLSNMVQSSIQAEQII